MSNSVKVKLLSLRDPDEIHIKFVEGEKSRNNVIAAKKIYEIQDNLAYLCKKSPKVENPKYGEVILCNNSIFFISLMFCLEFRRFMDVILDLGKSGLVEE